MASAFQANAFQNNAFQTVPPVPPVPPNPEGSGSVGGTFSRGQWRTIKEEDSQRRRVAAQAARLKKDKAALRLLQAKNAAREREVEALVAAARVAAGTQAQQQLALQEALRQKAVAFANAMVVAQQQFAIRQLQDELDEEEALLLLTLDD